MYRIGGVVHTVSGWIGTFFGSILSWAGSMKTLYAYGSIQYWIDPSLVFNVEATGAILLMMPLEKFGKIFELRFIALYFQNGVLTSSV